MCSERKHFEMAAGMSSLRLSDGYEVAIEADSPTVPNTTLPEELSDHDHDPHQISETNSSNDDNSSEGLPSGMLRRDIEPRTLHYDPYASERREQAPWTNFVPGGSPEVLPGANTQSPLMRAGTIPRTPSNTSFVLPGSYLPLQSQVSATVSGRGSQISMHQSQQSQQQLGQQVSLRTVPDGMHTPASPPAKAEPESKLEGPAAGALPQSHIAGSVFVGQLRSELETFFNSVHKVIELRRKYMALSLQRPFDNPRDSDSWPIYPPHPDPVWEQHKADIKNSDQDGPAQSSSNSVCGSKKPRKMGQDIGSDFEINEIPAPPGNSDHVFFLDDAGVFQVYESKEKHEASEPMVLVPTIREFYMDLDVVLNTSSNGPNKSFAFRRLQYLDGQFNLYVLMNEYQEIADTKRVPHRDFYNVRKVDTHVHHSACMNQKHLLRFIKSKMKKSPDEVVLFRDGKHLTLQQVFESINLTAYDLSIDTLDMHAHKDTFHRFDKFNLKYNPVGESRLREIFLKTDNFIKGRYLADITREVIADLEASKYQMVEWRISIYARTIDEWDKLAAWVVDNKLFSPNVRWLIQVPRLYDVYKATGLVENFEQIVRNLFQPLFEVSQDPSSHPKLHIFLQRVIGFDSVDDESKPERRLFRKFPLPRDWNSSQNPPYSYWLYFLFANMSSLNHLRQARGLSTLVLRPHCGEAGDPDHLAAAVLSCHSISHGLLLRKVPFLQYVFYLEQIGIAMSPLSNNALFLAYERNPFLAYFRRGLNVSLSTDDPLQFAFTREPLMEEYAVAAQIYKMSPVDMCELARRSVEQSGYEHQIKQRWIGPDYAQPGLAGSNMAKTNLPDVRVAFREESLAEEWALVREYGGSLAPTDGAAAVAHPSAAVVTPQVPVSGGGDGAATGKS